MWVFGHLRMKQTPEISLEVAKLGQGLDKGQGGWQSLKSQPFPGSVVVVKS